MPKSLVVLTADKQMQACVAAVLGRAREIGFQLDADDYAVLPDERHDPAVFRMGHEKIRAQLKQYRYAILMCDRNGSGAERLTRETMEGQMEARLAQNGWAGRSAAVVIDPELENWIWADSRKIDDILGWHGRQPSLREWLHSMGYLAEGQAKPADPKKCLEEALLRVRQKPSSVLFKQVAEQVSLARCTDPAFLKLVATLRAWFPAQQ